MNYLNSPLLEESEEIDARVGVETYDIIEIKV